MAITVDIGDRLYDYTDEEKAAEAVAEYQAATGADDQTVLDIWQNEKGDQRAVLERMIFEAVDANGSVKRAQESIPGDVQLAIN